MNPVRPLGPEDELEQRVAELLADERYAGHPMREVLEAMVERMGQQLLRLERITQISDRYQTDVKQREHLLSRRYDLQIRKLELRWVPFIGQFWPLTSLTPGGRNRIWPQCRPDG